MQTVLLTARGGGEEKLTTASNNVYPSQTGLIGMGFPRKLPKIRRMFQMRRFPLRAGRQLLP
ncbi:hypothetical protein GCM10007872_03630 [Gluconobacter sphaericus NBRC 12467]|uniref:Uncharacterized protein n=1 Tax=Gluconobacter sphaericus NBRC 12467 TaxID=1307951 RepID=A0AA37SE37_9PROT|nr:hypothetical protein GCM10007872_03630 [Gluconobacter sphaericus NBRC 12467]